MNGYLMKDRALNNTWRIERNERVDVDKTRPDHVFRKCEDVKKKERKLGERAGFCAKPVPSAELLGEKFMTLPTAAQPPSLLRPSFFPPYAPMPVPRNWSAGPDFLCLVP